MLHQERAEAEAADPERQDGGRDANDDGRPAGDHRGDRDPDEEDGEEEKEDPEGPTLRHGHRATLLAEKRCLQSMGNPGA